MSKEVTEQERLDNRARYIQREINNAVKTTRVANRVCKELFISKATFYNDAKRDLK